MIRIHSLAIVLCAAGLLSFPTATLAQTDVLVDATATSRHVDVTLQIPPPVFTKTSRGDEVSVSDFGRFAVPGAPEMPGRIFSIAIPPGARVTNVTVSPLETVALAEWYEIPPTPLPRFIDPQNRQLPQSEVEKYRENLGAVYGRDDLYPATAGHFVRTSGYRKYDMVDVCITPVSYRPRSGAVVYHPRIAVRVAYTMPGDSSPSAFRPDNLVRTERTARDIVLNYHQAQQWYGKNGPAAGRGLHDFVIITLDSLTAAVQPIVDWETTKGRNVNVVTTTWIQSNYTGYDLAEKMRNFLRDKYPSSDWGIEDVLLVGHFDDVVMRRCEQDVGYGKPETDYYFAELSLPDNQSWDADGDHRWGEDSDPIDFYNEVNVGRIPWSDTSNVQAICNKSVAYEGNNDPAFKQNILLLGSYFWPDTDNAVLMERKVDETWMSSWTMTRMYEQGYSTYSMDYNLTSSNVRSVWGAGKYAFVNWAGHGSPTSAHIYYNGSPSFVSNSSCSSLNDNYPSIIFADACSNADTDYDNIGRAMLQQGGVGFVGATKVAFGRPAWNSPNDGSSQSMDYYFTTSLTSTDYTLGGGHQRALREMYTRGLWSYNKYETFEWGALLGNPDLSMGEAAAISLGFPSGLPEGCHPPGPETIMTVEIRDGIESYVPGTGLLYYRFDPADSYSSVAVTPLGGGLYEVTLPHTRPGDAPEFYFEAQGDGGATVTSPQNAPATVYSFEVAFVATVMEDDFESDLGWTVVNQSISTGAWERVDPAGTDAQPEDDHSENGTKCFVTGGAGGSVGNDDVDGGPTRLISPAIDLADGDANLNFYLWFYHSTNGEYVPLSIHLSNDDGTSWTEIAQIDNNPSWSNMDYRVSDYLAPTPTVKIRFSASDNPNDSVVEGLVDDFKVQRYDYDPSLWADAYSISVATGETVGLHLDAGAGHAGKSYIVLGSLSGTSPGFDFAGYHVPLNWDWFSVATLVMAGSPYFVDFWGTLDPSGEATATFDTQGPVDPGYVGLGASFAYATFSPPDFVSNAITVTFEQ